MVSRRHELQEFKQFFAQIKPRQWRYWISLLSAVAVSTFITLLTAYVNKEIVNAVVDNDSAKFHNAAIWGAVLIVIACLYPFTRYSNIIVIRRIMNQLKSTLFKKLCRLEISYFEQIHSGDSIQRLTSDVEGLKSAYWTYMFVVIWSLFSGITAMFAMVWMDWRLSLLTIFLGVFSIRTNVYFSGKIRRRSDELQQQLSLLTQKLSDVLSGFRLVKLNSGSSIVIEKYKAQNHETLNTRMKRIKTNSCLDAVNFGFTTLSNMGVIVFGLILAHHDLIEYGVILGIVTLQSSVTNMFSKFGVTYAKLQECLSSGNRAFEILEKNDEPDLRVSNDESGDSRSMINFQDVSFKYGAEGSDILSSLSMSIEEGQKVAIVGLSGGGKSTILKLIMGFYSIHSGNISIQGESFNTTPVQRIRQLIAYVPQDAYLFEGSIKDNIRYGRLSATDQEIDEAAKSAFAHEFIINLSQGYETMVGTHGEGLSGGQKQRIAIARAFLRNAPILLLDEATSALDTESEVKVQHSLEDLMVNKTVLMVAHRLSTIKHADKIYVIQNGRVAESGTYDQLLEQDGLFRQLELLSGVS